MTWRPGTTVAAGSAPGRQFDLGPNGDAVYSDGTSIFRSRGGTTARAVPDSADQRYLWPVPDGSSVLYVSQPQSGASPSDLGMVDSTGARTLVARAGSTFYVNKGKFGYRYRVNHGWVYFVARGSGDPQRGTLGARTPSGQTLTLSALGRAFQIEQVGAEGALVYPGWGPDETTLHRYHYTPAGGMRDLGLARPGSRSELMPDGSVPALVGDHVLGVTP
ncbi:MAG: hypothetical protein JWM27_695 [Gemmatimonadetes bacterium]|nr:hypothetical protein [Gemmatimonadota bacterium]